MKKNSVNRIVASQVLVCFGIAGVLLAPARVWAHENIGGDELAVANWMLVGALVTIIMGIMAGVWAFRAGQFDNIEESKYRMLEQSDDLDVVIASANEAAREHAQAARASSGSRNKALSPEPRKEEPYHGVS